MAKIELLIPHILFRENSVKDSDPRMAYAKAAAKGVITLKDDRGGPTLAGVTLNTYIGYCKRKGLPTPTIDGLAKLTYEQWLEITKSGFWDRCRADEIAYQPTANMLVDWAYTSGANAIAGAQRALGVKADCCIGPKTLAALNASSLDVFKKIKEARVAYYKRIGVGTQHKYLNGWLNRVEAITPNGCQLK